MNRESPTWSKRADDAFAATGTFHDVAVAAAVVVAAVAAGGIDAYAFFRDDRWVNIFGSLHKTRSNLRQAHGPAENPLLRMKRRPQPR